MLLLPRQYGRFDVQYLTCLSDGSLALHCRRAGYAISGVEWGDMATWTRKVAPWLMLLHQRQGTMASLM
jgi:hypothetical protein